MSNPMEHYLIWVQDHAGYHCLVYYPNRQRAEKHIEWHRVAGMTCTLIRLTTKKEHTRDSCHLYYDNLNMRLHRNWCHTGDALTPLKI